MLMLSLPKRFDHLSVIQDGSAVTIPLLVPGLGNAFSIVGVGTLLAAEAFPILIKLFSYSNQNETDFKEKGGAQLVFYTHVIEKYLENIPFSAQQ